jgi:multicomponent K+:H+ antiporter subunit D
MVALAFIVVPTLWALGALLIRLLQHERLLWPLALSATLINAVFALDLFIHIQQQGPLHYFMGGWPPPFGIALQADLLSALMVFLTSILMLAAVFACRAFPYDAGFYALLGLELLGLNGAFLTGDLFNLFVFFEILLGASYGLLTSPVTGPRLRAGMVYLAANFVGSFLFLVGAALLYSATGTLNFSDLSIKIAALPQAHLLVVESAAVFLLGAFALKSGLVPFFFWLPGAYSNAPTPVAALFAAIMTKVGVYALLRMMTTVFVSRPEILTFWLWPLVLISLIYTAIAAFGQKDMRHTFSYLVIASSATVLLGALVSGALSAAIYYLAHSAMALGSAFFLASTIGQLRGIARDRLVAGPAFPLAGFLGFIYLIVAMSLAGMPPFAGFFGKVFLLSALVGTQQNVWVWLLILLQSFFTVFALARVGILVFWRIDPKRVPVKTKVDFWLLNAAMLLLFANLLLVVFLPASRTLSQTIAADMHIAN